MAHLADNPVTYLRRAHELGAVTISSPGVLVYEGNVSRFGGLVKERWVFDRTTGEFTIRILDGAESGAIRTIYIRSENSFSGNVQQLGLIKIQ